MRTRILFLGKYDLANIANRVARAINAREGAGTARVYSQPHPFDYEQDITTDSKGHLGVDETRALFDAARTSEWLVNIDDEDGYGALGKMLVNLPLPRTVRLATIHAGSVYRNNHEWFNQADAKLGFHRRIIGGDIYRFAKDDPTAVPFFAPPHETSTPAAQGTDFVRIAHSPSIRSKKGTAGILAALTGLDSGTDGRKVLLDLIENVSFAECAQRRALAHIFIDQLNPEVGGFGASSVEAMTAGCAVLASTNNIGPEVAKFYLPPPIIHVGNPDELRARLMELIDDPALLHTQQRASLDWAQRCASTEAIARYWLGVLA